MSAARERLQDLLDRVFAHTGASSISWAAGAGRPSGTAVELFGPGGPMDGTIAGGAAQGEITTRLTAIACTLLAEVDDRMSALGLTRLQATVDLRTCSTSAAGSGPEGALLLLPPTGASYPFSPEAASLLESLPDGRTLLVSGLSAHERLALGADGTMVRDGDLLGNLLSPIRLPAGTRQGVALRQGTHVALVEAARPFPLFHRIP